MPPTPAHNPNAGCELAPIAGCGLNAATQRAAMRVLADLLDRDAAALSVDHRLVADLGADPAGLGELLEQLAMEMGADDAIEMPDEVLTVGLAIHGLAVALGAEPDGDGGDA